MRCSHAPFASNFYGFFWNLRMAFPSALSITSG